jgi:hypothetical protein
MWAISVCTSGTAAASCVGPSISVDDTSVAAGQAVVVSGEGFGTECNDRGPNGDLGRPEPMIGLVVIQGTKAFQVASVGATDRYTFRVRVAMPEVVDSGPVTLFATSSLGVIPNGVALTITGRSPAGDTTGFTILEGRSAAEPEPESRGGWVLIGAAGAAIAAAIVVVGLRRRTRRS